ncbi:MAG: arsenic efflux protein [Muribaculaceae bacterium]|nr:arsenic efflux protein [Muribaculaceae bacterium]
MDRISFFIHYFQDFAASILPEFVADALADSLKLVPFLFVVFIIIELLEHYFVKKRHLVVFFMKKIGPAFGSLFASIPQCGFSVVATTLYTRRILSRGTLLAVYLATSDEAIPVLISEPSKIYLILPIILVKVFVAIIVGYLVDSLVKYEADAPALESTSHNHTCSHQHNLSQDVKAKAFWFYPLKHTFNIFIFILIVSLILGYLISNVGTEENLAKYCLMDSPLQPIIASLIGLIPNCAISVMLTVMFVKHTISFGSLLAGLSSAGGLGLLVLLTKNKDKKDTVIVLAILVLVSSVLGLIFQYNLFGINNLFSFFGINL